MINNGSKTVLFFSWKKSTPGTYVYQQVDDLGLPMSAANGASIPTLYIRQDAMPTKLMKLKIEISGE